MVILVAALRYRRQRAAPRALHAPRRRDDAHAVHALHRPHHVDAAGGRPPARPRLLHEREAFQPGLLPEWRRIAAELAAVQLEAQYAQPVAQPEQADEARIPGHAGMARSEELPRAPERGGIEAGDHHMALRHQPALRFAE